MIRSGQRSSPQPAQMEVAGMRVTYGGVVALSDVDLRIDSQGITGLIGPNGSGKTTLFNALTGWVRPNAGRVRFEGEDITGLRPHQVARRGIARSFQLVSVFPDLTCRANVVVGSHLSLAPSVSRALLRPRAERRRRQQCLREARLLLEAVGLGDRVDERAGALAYGDWKRVDVARSLAMRPRVLLLDEPAAGLDRDEKAQLSETIRRTAVENKLTVVVVEHDVEFVSELCSRVIVLDEGRLVADGSPDEIYRSSVVAEVYLGGAQHA